MLSDDISISGDRYNGQRMSTINVCGWTRKLVSAFAHICSCSLKLSLKVCLNRPGRMNTNLGVERRVRTHLVAAYVVDAWRSSALPD